MNVTRRTFAKCAASVAVGGGSSHVSATDSPQSQILVTDSGSDTLTRYNFATLETKTLVVGRAPWGMARVGNVVWVSTAEGVAVVTLDTFTLEGLIPYETPAGSLGYGEYREGGMGIAASADGSLVFVGNYIPGGDRLEVIDTSTNTSVGSAPIGVRAFDVLCNPDGTTAWSIDHDSYSVTSVDTATLSSSTWPVSPLGDANGLAGFEKPHYAVLDDAGDLLLPFQGQALAIVDTETGRYESVPLSANTHQHGIAQSGDVKRLFIVGTGPAGDATGPASLAIVDLASQSEDLIVLDRPHERIALSKDESFAFLTGGYSFANGGWDGITAVGLESRVILETPLGSKPMDILVLD